MHLYYIIIKSSQKFWVVYVRYRIILEQCEQPRLSPQSAREAPKKPAKRDS